MPTQEERVKVIAEIGLAGGENLDNLEDRLARLQKVNNTKVKALDTSFNDVDKRVKAVNKSALTLVATLERLGNRSGAAGLNSQATAATKAQLAQDKLANSARKLKQDQDKLDANQIKLAAGFERAANAQKRADQETQRLANSQKRLEVQTQKLNAQFSNQSGEKFSKTLGQIQANVDKLGSSIESAGKKLTVGLTAPLVGGAVAGAKFAGDLEESIAEISTIAPQIDTSKLNKQLVDMSTRIPVAANDIAAAVYQIFSSIDVNQDQAVGLAEIFAKGARAAKTDIDSFGTAILGVINAYKLDVSDASFVSDIFFNTVNKGVINGRELAQELGGVTQSAKLAGISYQDLGAYISAVTKEGGTAAENMTALNKAFIDITDPKAQEKLQNLLGKGSTQDAAGNFLPLVDVLEKLKTKLATFSEVDKANALKDIFGDIRGFKGISILLSQLDFLKDTMKYNADQVGSTEMAYAKMVKTTNAQFQLLKNIGMAALIDIGNVILPILLPLFKQLGEYIIYLTQQFAGLSDSGKIFSLIITGIAAAIGPILIVVGALIGYISPLIGFIFSAGGALSTLGGLLVSFGGFITAFIGLIGEAGLVASFSALVSVLGGSVLTAFAALSEILIPLAIGLAAVIVVVGAFVAAIAAAAYLAYKIWTQNIGGIQQKTFAIFKAVSDFIISTFNQIKKIFIEVLPYIESLTKKVLDSIQSFWDLHGENIVKVVQVLWNIIKVVTTEGINIIASIIKFVLQVINGDWSGAWESYKSIVTSGWKIIGNIVGAGVRLIIEFIQFLLREMFSLLDRFIEAGISLAKGFINGIVDFIKNSPGLITSAIKYLLTDAIGDAGNAAYNFGAKLWGYVVSGYEGGKASNPLPIQDNIPKKQLSIEDITFRGDDYVLLKDKPKKAKPTGSYSGGRGGGGGKSKKEKNIEPIDEAIRASSALAREDDKLFNKINTGNIERAKELTKHFGTELRERLNLAFVSVTDYYKQIREARAKDFDLEIAELLEKQKRAELILSRTPVGKDDEGKRKRDKAEADVISSRGDTNRKIDEKALTNAELYRDELDAIFEVVDANKELSKTYLELTDQTRKLADVELVDEFNKKIEQNRLNLSAARKRLTEAEAAATTDASNAPLVERYKLLVETLTKNAELLESINTQKTAQADFNENQKQLNVILDKRQTAVDDLNRSIEETGVGEDEATKLRRALMQSYQGDIDKVIERLEFLSATLQNPEAKKALEALKKARADEQSVPFAEKLRGVQRPLEDMLQSRDRRLTENDLSGKSEIEKELTKKRIIQETTAELLKQADAYVALAMASGNPKIIQDALSQRDAIRQTAAEYQSFSTQVRNTAVDAFASGLSTFFQDIASGAVSAGDALLNFAGSFIQAIQQIIVQLLAYMLIALILKSLGIPIPAGIAQGAVIGKKDGGAASSIPGFAKGGAPGNSYSGGLLVANGGMINGVGSSRSDSIPTYFPAAQRFAKTSNTEFVVDAESTKNVGVDRLNALIQNKGKNFDELFGLGFASGGAVSSVSDAVGSNISGMPAPEINQGANNLNMNQLNYVGKDSIEQVIADHALSNNGDRVFVNQIDRNFSKLKAKLGIKS